MKDIIKRTTGIKGQRVWQIARIDNSKWANIATEWTLRGGKEANPQKDGETT